MKNQTKTAALTRAAMTAALYVVLTLVANILGLANGAVQIRLSEALTVAPIFFAESIGGLTIGCLIANLITGCAPLDVIFGTIATLLGALGTRALRKSRPLAVMCPIVSNTVIVPFVLKFAYGLGDAWWYMAFTVCIGEIISCALIGTLVIKIFDKHKTRL